MEQNQKTNLGMIMACFLLYKPRMKQQGFTLIELMIVVAIIGIMAAIALPQFLIFSAKAKRAEAYSMLKAVHNAQVAYFSNNNHYAYDISGSALNINRDLGIWDANQPVGQYKYYDQYFFAPPSTASNLEYLCLLGGNINSNPTMLDQLIIKSDSWSQPFAAGQPSGIPVLKQDSILNITYF